MRFSRFSLVLLLTCPVFADLNQTTTLQSNTTLNFDTGATSTTGGDVLWNGTTITPQGNATALVIYDDWPLNQFNTISSLVVSLVPGYSKNAIPAAKIKTGMVFGVHTGTSHYAKAIMVSNTGGALALQFTTYGVAAGTGGGGTTGPPNITSIKNNSSLIRAGLPNYGIAPSSIFVIAGTGLADAGTPVLQSSAAPGLLLTLNGASIGVTVGGVTTHPAIYYTSPTQIAAVLPAGTPTGAGTVTVTYKGVASNAAAILVVPAALGINVYNSNTGVATDSATGALLTYNNSGTPGETIVLWTTGLGADPADSDTTYSSAPQSVNTPLQIYIGGLAASILYQGSAGYPGVNQINLTIPAGVPNGCWISLAAVAGGVGSNIATLPINAAGGGCVDSLTGLSGNQISPPGGKTIRTGLVGLIQTNATDKNGVKTTTNSADAAFVTYNGLYTPPNSISPGGCIVNDLTPVDGAVGSGLDPGTMMLAGPGGLSVKLGSPGGIKGTFFSTLATGAIPIAGGAFTFAGSGGADVGAFSTTVTLANPLLSWTNQSVAASVDRSQPLSVTWTGGAPGSYVFITGTAATPAGLAGGYTCLANASDGHFTVPAYILSALPAGNGGMGMQNDVYSSFTASGLDTALALGDVAFTTPSVYK